ncbi:hypothetical protein WG66_014163 [Moniliophthora roreri]|nr:hypothetical protein WG66_014163 [Moniliophthora roreri]
MFVMASESRDVITKVESLVLRTKCVASEVAVANECGWLWAVACSLSGKSNKAYLTKLDISSTKMKRITTSTIREVSDPSRPIAGVVLAGSRVTTSRRRVPVA